MLRIKTPRKGQARSCDGPAGAARANRHSDTPQRAQGSPFRQHIATGHSWEPDELAAKRMGSPGPPRARAVRAKTADALSHQPARPSEPARRQERLTSNTEARSAPRRQEGLARAAQPGGQKSELGERQKFGPPRARSPAIPTRRRFMSGKGAATGCGTPGTLGAPERGVEAGARGHLVPHIPAISPAMRRGPGQEAPNSSQGPPSE